MKALATFLLTGLCALHVGALPAGAYGLAEDSARRLQGLRLRKSQEALIEAPAVHPELRQRILELADKDLTDAALRDLSTGDASRRMAARVRVHELARIADTPLGADALAAAGWSSERLRSLSTRARAPLEELRQLREQFGTDAQGRLLLRPRVLIVNPETPAPDNWLPGKVPAGYHGKPPVWRRGLLFAAAIGIQPQGTKPQAFCSGTVVGKYWIVTAAHCLLHEGQRLPRERLFAFLPFQAGTQEVLNAAGGLDRNLRSIAVADVKWVGDGTGQPFPSTAQAMANMVLAGMDLALLRLDAAEVDALPVSIPDVRLATDVKQAPVSMIGFGLSDKAAVDGISMGVGVRNDLPAGVASGDEVFFFASQAAKDRAGLCGGDSGGGLFEGRVDGAPGSSHRLFAVISGLVSASTSVNVDYCLAGEQAFTSLMTKRSRGFMCETLTGVCSEM